MWTVPGKEGRAEWRNLAGDVAGAVPLVPRVVDDDAAVVNVAAAASVDGNLPTAPPGSTLALVVAVNV